MKLSQSLQLKQSQSLVMTQQLQQSIKLLQLSSLELQEFVDAELEKNPLLTQDETSVQPADTASAPDTGDDGATQVESALANLEETLDSNYSGGWQHEGADATFSPMRATHASPSTRYGGDEDSNLEQYVASETSLPQHLHNQLPLTADDPQLKLIASQLIDMLGEDGYLREATDSLCETLGAQSEQVEEAIAVLQRCEPTGVAARNLAECLRLQLAERNLLDPMMEVMLAHLSLMEQGKAAELQRRCGADDEDFAQMLAQLRELDPHPGYQFNHDLAQPVIPDVLVRRTKREGWRVELNDETLPRVLVDKEYFIELDGHAHNKEDKRYLSEQFSQANWLVKAIDQRAQTLLKVTSEIVKTQDAFMRYGIQFLKPLTLKDIADKVEMHESTISRVTTNKYVSTPRGIFELKYFFTSSIHSTGGGDDVSSKTVMYYIKQAVEEEDPNAVLSDDAIVKLLQRRNIDVARRTVAKYREALHIPSSVVRRRQKKQAGA